MGLVTTADQRAADLVGVPDDERDRRDGGELAGSQGAVPKKPCSGGRYTRAAAGGGCTIRPPQCGPQTAKSGPATVTPISTATNRPGKAITLGPTRWLSMAITPNGRTVYAGYGTAIILIRAATNKACKPIKLGWEADHGDHRGPGRDCNFQRLCRTSGGSQMC